MKTLIYVYSATIVFISVFQLCPAPPLLAAAAAVGAATLGLAKHKRAESAAVDSLIRRYPVAWKACKTELGPASVNVSFVGKNEAYFDGVPPACLHLADVYLAGNPQHASLPTVVGSSTLRYYSLTPYELKSLKDVVAAKKASKKNNPPKNNPPKSNPPKSNPPKSKPPTSPAWHYPPGGVKSKA